MVGEWIEAGTPFIPMALFAIPVGEGRRIFCCPLNADLVAVVVGHILDARDKLRCAGVCTGWRAGVGLPSAWVRTALCPGGTLDRNPFFRNRSQRPFPSNAVAALVGRIGGGLVHLVLSDQTRECDGAGFNQMLQAISEHGTQLASLKIVCDTDIQPNPRTYWWHHDLKQAAMRALRTLAARRNGGLMQAFGVNVHLFERFELEAAALCETRSSSTCSRCRIVGFTADADLHLGRGGRELLARQAIVHTCKTQGCLFGICDHCCTHLQRQGHFCTDCVRPPSTLQAFIQASLVAALQEPEEPAASDDDSD